MSKSEQSNADRFVTQVVDYFKSHSDRDDVTAQKARLVFTATREHGVTLGVLAQSIAVGMNTARETKQGLLTAVPSKASLSNYGTAYELATIAGVSGDAYSVARLFTTVSASAVKPSDLRDRVKAIGEMSDDASKLAAVADIPTSKMSARKSDPAERKGEGDDSTTDLKGSEVVTVAAVAQGLGLLAARIADGQVSAADVKRLTAAWGKVAAAVQSLNVESPEVVESALASV